MPNSTTFSNVCIVLMHWSSPPSLPVTNSGFPSFITVTGTGGAYRPDGSLERSGMRPPATGDYQPWKPE